MRQFGESLGSATFLTHGNGHGSEGNKVANSTKFYTPFGEYRIQPPDPTDDITDRGYTGHRHNDELELIYMNARFFLPVTGRFISADTLIPDPTNPQSHNRYSYVLNSVLNYTDPTGHYMVIETDDGDINLNEDEEGEITVIGGDAFNNAVEIAIANFFLTGNENFLDVVDEYLDESDYWVMSFHIDYVWGVLNGGTNSSFGLFVDPFLAFGIGTVIGKSLLDLANQGITVAGQMLNLVKNLPKNPNDLLSNGWVETTHPQNQSGSRDFKHLETGLEVRFDPGTSGADGHRGSDHYHVLNPYRSSRQDQYLDANGNPVRKGSNESHINPNN